MSATAVSFGPFVLDPAAGRLLRNGEPVPASGSGVRILEALLEARGGAVTKELLLERGWPGTIVEEGNLTVQIAKLRDLLQTGNERGEWIVTKAIMSRSARVLMEGWVRVPGDAL